MNMKPSHMILIALGTLAVLAIAMLIPRKVDHRSGIAPDDVMQEAKIAQEDDQMGIPSQNPALTINGKTVSPLCFVKGSGEESLPSYPVQNCADDQLRLDPKSAASPLDSNEFISNSYVEAMGDGGEEYHGYVGYRYLGTYDNHYAVRLVENGGGSGVFVSLVLLDYDKASDQLVTREIVATGDRCNGAVAAAEITGGKLVYERDVTPYDMMSLVGDPQRPVLQSAAAHGLPSCASCCYGRAQFDGDRFIGLLFDRRLPQGFAHKNYSSASAAEKCLDDKLGTNMKQGHIYYNADDFKGLVKDIEQTCLGGQTE